MKSKSSSSSPGQESFYFSLLKNKTIMLLFTECKLYYNNTNEYQGKNSGIGC